MPSKRVSFCVINRSWCQTYKCPDFSEALKVLIPKIRSFSDEIAYLLQESIEYFNLHLVIFGSTYILSFTILYSGSLVDVLLGQPIKLIQVASNSELHENQWNDLLFFEIVPSHCFGASEVQT